MDKETANYIIEYFRHLLPGDEKLAVKQQISAYQVSDKPEINRILANKDWIQENPNSYEEFETSLAKHIVTEFPEKVFLNNCRKCNKLARTPYAKQCRHCGYSWHTLSK